jgi:hypothetical protein
LLLLVVPLMLLAYPRIREVRKAFDRFSNALIARDYQRAYQATGADFQEALSEKDFVAQQEALTEHYGPLKEVSMWDTVIDYSESGQEADLRVDFKYERSTQVFDVAMRSYGGEWKLSGYRQR